MSCQTPFQEKHKLEFGLAPVQRAPDGTITTVQCLFCVHIGREKRDGPAVKRQHTKNVQLFQFPFRPECYKSHMQSQHTDEWAKYQTLSPVDKLAYFNKKEATRINAFLDKDCDNLTFAISQPTIVDDIVGNLFFNLKEDEEDDNSESITKANAMKLFKLQEDGSYLVIIKNSLRFNLAIEHVFVGLSFRQTAVAITLHRNLCKNSKLAGRRRRPVVDVHHYESKTCMGVFTGCWRQLAYGSLSTRSASSNLCWRGALQPPYGPGSILWTTSGRQLRETHQNHARYSLPKLALQIDFDQLWRGEHDDQSTRRSCHLAWEGVQQPCAPDLVRPTSIGHCRQERHARCFGSGILQSSPCLFCSFSSAAKSNHRHGIQMPERHDALGCIW